MPRMLYPEVPIDAQLALAEEIHANAPKLTVDSEFHGQDPQSMIATLASRFADGVVFGTSEVITSALHRCIKLKASEACVKITQSLVTASREATPDFLETVLIPIIPTLRELLTLSHPPLTGAIDTFFQVVSARWVAVVLGQKPTHDPSAFTSLTHWDCTCADCRAVQKFLRKPSLERRSLSLEKIGARRRKHIETYLHKYAMSVAIYSTIQTSPQGLQVCDFNHHCSVLPVHALLD